MMNKRQQARADAAWRRARALRVDWGQRVTVPIRDMKEDGRIVFCVDVYGVNPSDLSQVCLGKPPDDFIGSRPMVRAVRRLGLDPNRYQAVIWDLVP